MIKKRADTSYAEFGLISLFLWKRYYLVFSFKSEYLSDDRQVFANIQAYRISLDVC